MTNVLTVHEAALCLGVHYNSIYQLIREKKLKCIRIGRIIRIPNEYIEEFIKNSIEI